MIGQAWQEYLAEGNAKQPRKRVGADALIRDEHGRLLLVDPKYKPDWDIPGGMAEANEPPLDAVLRELHEELGLLLPAQRVVTTVSGLGFAARGLGRLADVHF
ncbi:NUDIX domain-containing protein [Nocardia fusca]|uniref:NUDIX domain-containing protein n=1 Tax=Nocardia fusca TaxID=941183 RepID=UPI00379EB405